MNICCVRHCSRCLEISLNQIDKVLTLMELIFCGRGEIENKQVNHVFLVVVITVRKNKAGYRGRKVRRLI